jgi:hypothetical protein
MSEGGRQAFQNSRLLDHAHEVRDRGARPHGLLCGLQVRSRGKDQLRSVAGPNTPDLTTEVKTSIVGPLIHDQD